MTLMRTLTNSFWMFLVVSFLLSYSAHARELIVGNQKEFTTIRGAIEASLDGDTIIITQGVYKEKGIVTAKSLTLKGEQGAVLDGEGSDEILRFTNASPVIEQLTFLNAGVSYTRDNAALKIENGRNCRILHNKFYGNFFSIYLSKTENCLIEGNDIQGIAEHEAGAGNGIHLWSSSKIIIRKNHIKGHRDGIYFEFVTDSSIEENTSEGSLRYGLHFMFSDRCTYAKNLFMRNGAGVAVMYTKNIEMKENTFSDNWGPASYGLLLKDIKESSIHANVFRRNSTALMIEGSNRLQVSGNEVINNGWALKLMGNSMENSFIDNSFIANSFDVATNAGRSTNLFKGNYWDTYQGYDLNKDGTGDVPFRPVTLFSSLVEKTPALLFLLRSFVVEVLDAAERVFPVLTPETLMDESPKMRRNK